MKAFATRAWHVVVAVILRIRSDEPLRNRLYPFIIVASGWIVRQGYISESVMQIVLGVGFLIGGWGAVEWARRLVTPMSKVGPMVASKGQQSYVDGVTDAIEAATDDLSARAEAALATLPPQVQSAVEVIRAQGEDYAAKVGHRIDVPAILAAAREAGSYFGNRGEHRS